MAGMKFKVEADLEKLDRLKTKMDDLKKSMTDLNEKTDPKKMRDLESQLVKTEKEFNNVGASVQKTTAQMQDMEAAGGKAVQGIAENLRQAITNQKQLIREIKKDIDDLNAKSKDKNLTPGQKGEVSADLAAAKRALAEEKGTLLGMQSKQIEMNAEEMVSQGGLIAMAGKWVTGLLSVGVAMKFLKTTIESTETTAHMFERVTEQITEGTAFFFKTLASGDWTNFLEGMEKAITGAREYVDELEHLENLRNQQKIHSSVLDVKIGAAFADSYSTDPKVQKKALEEIIKLNKEKYTGEAEIAKENYRLKAQEIADRNGWNLKDLENTITYYTKMKPIIEDGERYIQLMTSRKAFEGGMIGETRIKADDKALGKIDAQMLQIPNGNYAAGIARSFGKVTFPERDEVADLLAQANTAEAQIELNNKRIQMRLRSLRAQEESEANAAAKKKVEYEIEVGRRRVETALDIEQQVINAERDGMDKSRHQAELNYRKTMAELDQRKADMLRKQNEISGGIDKDTGKRTKSYNSKLNPADQAQLDQLGTLAASVRDKAILDQLLIDFETFQQKRVRISEEFDKKIKLVAGTPAENEAKYQKQEAIDALDKQIAARSAIYSRWSKELASKSLDDIDSLLKDYETYSVQLNKNGNLTDDDKAVLREKVRALQVRIQELTSNKNVTKETKKDESETLKTMNEINEAVRNIISSFSDMDDSSKAMFTSITNITGGVIGVLTGIEKAGSAAFAAMGSAEKASVVLAIMGAILQVYNAVRESIKSIAHAGDAKREADREEYLALVAYNDELRSRYDWTKKIGEATVAYLRREGEELAKQSTANEKDQSDLWRKLQKSTYKDGQKTNMWNERVINWESLSGKTYEQIGALAAEGKLSKEGEAYYEALKKAKEEGKDLVKMQEEYLEKLRETYTGTTYDSVVTAIVDGFKAGKRSASDFADTFGDLMRGALLSSLTLLTDEKVRAWYKHFATLSSDGLSADEKAILKKEWDGIINDLAARSKVMEDVTGVSLTDSNTTATSGSKSSFTSMSQDSADKLEGRFMALQISSESGRDVVLSIDRKTDLVVDATTSMSQSSLQVLEETRNIRTIQIQSMYYLEDIAKYTKVLPGMAEDIAQVKKNTDRL